MSTEQQQQIVLDPTVPEHAIEIIDQILQPGVQMNRQSWGIAEVCVRTIRKKLSEKDQATTGANLVETLTKLSQA